MLSGGLRQIERHVGPRQPHHPLEPAGNIADHRGSGKTSPAAQHTRQCTADVLLREGAFENPRPPGQMAHAEQRHEGDGEMGPDPALSPVEDRPYLQVALGAAEGPLDLQEFGTMSGCVTHRHFCQVGHHLVKPVPAGLPGDTGLVRNQFGLALDPQEAVKPADAVQPLRIVAAGQAVAERRGRRS